MTHHAQSLLREAHSLPVEERADLVADVLVSLEGPPEDDEAAAEQAWAEELERRARRVLAFYGDDRACAFGPCTRSSVAGCVFWPLSDGHSRGVVVNRCV